MTNEKSMQYITALAEIHGMPITSGFSLADIAKLLDTTETAITKMFRTGKLKPFRTHRNRFVGVLGAELERYLADMNSSGGNEQKSAPVVPPVQVVQPIPRMPPEMPTGSLNPADRPRRGAPQPGPRCAEDMTY